MPQISASQDLDPRFSVFLNPIRDLTKNWEVDIAKYLEEYLEELSEVQITFNGGQTVMNFAQAAMLIQGSATVYSKKVEFLWQMVLQMLELLSSQKAGVNRSEFGGSKEPGSGVKTVLDISQEFSLADNISAGRNINLRDDQDDDDADHRHRSLRLLPATPVHLEKEGEKSHKKVSLVVRGNEVFGAKDDFRINRSFLTPKGMLCLEVPTEILQGGACFPDLDPILQEIVGEENVSSSCLPLQQEQPQTQPETDVEEPQNTAEDDDDPVDVELDPDPEPDLEEQQHQDKDESKEKVDVEKEAMAKESNTNNLTVIDLPNTRYGLRRQGGNKEEVVATLKLTEPWKPLDPHAETPARRPIRSVRLRRPPLCACHRPSRTLARRKGGKDKEMSEEVLNKKKILVSVESYITNELSGKVGSTAHKDSKVPTEILEEVNREKTRRMEAGRQQRIRDLVRAGISRNEDEALQKVAEEEENNRNIDQQLDDPLDLAPDLDCDDDVPATPPLFLPEPHDVTQHPEPPTTKKFNDTHFDEPCNDYEALVQKWVSDYISTAQEQVNSSDLARRVNKWKDAITPRLKEEESRQEFDIHHYGSKVLSYFPDNGQKTTVSFNNIVCDEDPREVSRLFLSCLMLANTHNIELSESCPGYFAMDCLELTLLSRVRHHEELEDYNAPSQVTTPRRKGREGNSHSRASGACIDITQAALAGHNVPVRSSLNRPKAKSRHR